MSKNIYNQSWFRAAVLGAALLVGSVAHAQDTNAYAIFAPGALTIGNSGFDGRFRRDGGVSSTAIYQYGLGGELKLGKGFGAGAEVTGISGRRFDLNSTIVALSPNVYYHFRGSGKAFDPFVTGGYTFFARPTTSNLANFGGGFNYYLNNRFGLRLEARDHVPFDNGRVHYWGIRFGVVLR